MCSLFVQCEPALQEPAGGQRVYGVLHLQNAQREAVRGVMGLYRDTRLQYGWATVQLGGDKVDGASGLTVSGVNGPLVCVQPRVLGQQ